MVLNKLFLMVPLLKRHLGLPRSSISSLSPGISMLRRWMTSALACGGLVGYCDSSLSPPPFKANTLVGHVGFIAAPGIHILAQVSHVWLLPPPF